MSGEQNYTVSYKIDVDATKGTDQVENFAKAVKGLLEARNSITPYVNNIKNMMNDIDKVFRNKSGKKRDYNFKMNIDTGKTEEKLGRVKTLLTEIQGLTKGISLTINGQPLDSKNIKAKAETLLNKKKADESKAAIEKSATDSVKTMMETQTRITKAIGKINAALMSLEKGREVNIKTDVAKQRLQEILSLMNQIKGASKMTLGMGMGSPGSSNTGNAAGVVSNHIKPPFAYNPQRGYVMPQAVTEKLAISQAFRAQKAEFARADEAARLNMQRALIEAKGREWDRQREVKAGEAAQKRAAAEAAKAIREKARLQQQDAAQAVTAVRQQQRAAMLGQTQRQKGAINRLQYVRLPTVRSLPMMQMFNAYAIYGQLRSELMQAVEYSNIMTSAQSILRVADNDLTTFERRFEKMALYVRQIGVETKFTAIEVGGAVKYLAMAGMSVNTINEAIRPITNLALIGDNDVAQIADLATNIMAGYDIKSGSMNSVADILASTVSRSNVNVIEMAESYKMAAGYLRLAGVKFSESSAAVGILGNMGVKGTMAGTALRAMVTRFAKPTNESQETLDRLGVKFTEYRDIYGKQVEKLRPLADIFEELNKKGATLGDMQAIFGKIGGNAAMMFINNYEQLRTLTTQNQISHGISSELAKVKQENTKGLWDQVTSQFSEAFMKGYDVLEPVIRSMLRDFLSKFNAAEFSRGLTAIGQSLLNIMSLLGNVATWFARNFDWLEPLIFSTFVATRLFKLAGALTNVGVALGFLGKQSAANAGLQAISSLVGPGGGKLSFGNKRSIVSVLSGAGVSGKGAMTQALVSAGAGGMASRSVMGLFSSQVTTGNGLVGAGASIGALGTGAVVATAGIAALVGALGWLAYKTWKVKEAKDAVQEEIKANRKYRYPSIEALNNALSETYNTAINAKKGIDELTTGKTIEEASGQKIGAFSSNWWAAIFNALGRAAQARNGMYSIQSYSVADAYQDDTRAAILTLAEKDGQARINSAYAELGKARTDIEIMAFRKNIQSKYGQDMRTVDHNLYRIDQGGNVVYSEAIETAKEANAYKYYDYALHMNDNIVPEVTRLAEYYQQIMSSQQTAQQALQAAGFDFDELTKKGFYQDKNGNWMQKEPDSKASPEERSTSVANFNDMHSKIVTVTSSLRDIWGGSPEIAENIIKKAGFGSLFYSNEPDSNDPHPYNANGITYNDPDDGMAGGNYSGTGKLTSAAPKQVIVTITNLLSVETITLMKSENGQSPEIQNLKEQMAQALIDVVHDFDASWNG